MKVVIIGGVAGGATAAARLRRLDETAEIIVLERGGYVSYANCGLPYYIGGTIADKAALTLQTPESFWARFAIDVRVRQQAVRIDRSQKTVRVQRLEDGTEYDLAYDKLILSPGAHPLRPELPGVEDGRIFTLRTVEDTLAIRAFVEREQPRRAVVVGGGYIGLEMAENLTHAGVEVTVVQKPKQVMGPLDADMASQVHAYLREQGVALALGETVRGFVPGADALQCELEDGRMLPADLVILAIGVAPETALAQQAGLATGVRGAIVTDAHMRTEDADIYAVGDAVQAPHAVTGEATWIALAGPANKQGRIAADNIAGIASTFKGAQGSSVIQLFDMTVATTGLNEKQAKAAGLEVDKVVTFSASHATYYPGATNMTIKLVFEKQSGRVLGAQIVGFDGVDKRCDVLATAIRAGMTTADLTELDLCYAPPYASAKDPVNMAGYVAENVRTGLCEQFHWDEVDAVRADANAVLLDVRTEGERRQGCIEGTLHIPLDELRARLDELPRDKKIYVHCHSGLRSYIACRILAAHGWECATLSGGYRFYALNVQDSAFDGAPRHACGLTIGAQSPRKHARSGKTDRQGRKAAQPSAQEQR